MVVWDGATLELRSNLVLRSAQLRLDEADPFLELHPLGFRMGDTAVLLSMPIELLQERAQPRQQEAAIVKIDIDRYFRRALVVRMTCH